MCSFISCRSPLAIVHTLQPREVMYFTWDDPSGKKAIRWNFPGVAKVTNCKPIDVNKVYTRTCMYVMLVPKIHVLHVHIHV